MGDGRMGEKEMLGVPGGGDGDGDGEREDRWAREPKNL